MASTETKNSELDMTRKGARKLIRKNNVAKFNTEYKPFTLDPTKFSVDKSCKGCHGTGKSHYDEKGSPVACRCVKLTPEYKESIDKKLKDRMEEKETPTKE